MEFILLMKANLKTWFFFFRSYFFFFLPLSLSLSLSLSLLLDFKKEDVKIQVSDHTPGQMTVSGERKVDEDKYINFKQTFEVPENTEVDQITGQFDGEFLHVTVPKQAVEDERDDEIVKEYVDGSAQENEHEEPPTNDDNLSRDDEHHQDGNIHGSCQSEEEKRQSKGNSHMGFPEETKKKWEINHGHSIINLKSVANMLKRNKEIVISAVLAFSLGVLVSRMLE